MGYLECRYASTKYLMTAMVLSWYDNGFSADGLGMQELEVKEDQVEQMQSTETLVSTSFAPRFRAPPSRNSSSSPTSPRAEGERAGGTMKPGL